MWTDSWEYHFYAGKHLLEVIKVDREIIAKFVPEAVSPMSLVWELFQVARGEEEVARLVELNGMHKGATYEVRCVPSEHEEWVRGLTYSNLLDAYRKKKEEV